MNNLDKTNEFSICLITDEQSTKKIEKLRNSLEDSSYRDDTPHITLLRGIMAPSNLEDNELLISVDKILQLDKSLPVDAFVDEVKNMSNQFYSASGVILLQPSPLLDKLRKTIIDKLKENSYTIEHQEINAYRPHITVRLGVPLDGENMVHADKDFPDGSSVHFVRWVLLRLIKDGDDRLMQELSFES